MSKIYAKLITAKKSFPAIIKDTKGYGYTYANLSQVIEAISEPLWNAGLDFYQTIKDGKMQTGIIDAESAEKIELVEFEVISATIAKSTDIQALGGGITYLRRYSLMLAFGLGVEDDDGAGKSKQNQSNTPAPKQSPPPPSPKAALDQNGLYTLLAAKKHLLTHDQAVKTEAGIASNDSITMGKIEQWLNGLS